MFMKGQGSETLGHVSVKLWIELHPFFHEAIRASYSEVTRKLCMCICVWEPAHVWVCVSMVSIKEGNTVIDRFGRNWMCMLFDNMPLVLLPADLHFTIYLVN